LPPDVDRLGIEFFQNQVGIEVDLMNQELISGMTKNIELRQVVRRKMLGVAGNDDVRVTGNRSRQRMPVFLPRIPVVPLTPAENVRLSAAEGFRYSIPDIGGWANCGFNVWNECKRVEAEVLCSSCVPLNARLCERHRTDLNRRFGAADARGGPAWRQPSLS